MTPSGIDPPDQVSFLRAQAVKARRLAHSMNDEYVVTQLMRYADELDERALELESAGAPSRETWGGLEY
jgi:hypothetical protein